MTFYNPQPVIAAATNKLQNEDAAEMLSISQRTLDRPIAGKALPVRRIGRRVLITYDALQSFANRNHPTGVLQ